MRKRTTLILELTALAAAIAAASAVTLVAPGGTKRATLFVPAILGDQPHGAVVLAQEDKDLAVALALRPQAKGLLAVVTILGQNGAGATGLSTSVSVSTGDGATVSAVAQPAARGTYQALLATTSRPVRTSVTIDSAGASNRPRRFALPTAWPPRDASKLMQRVTRVYSHLRTLVTHERLASDPTHVVNSVYKAIAPDSLAIDSSNGQRAVVIGHRRWDKQAGGDWEQSLQNPPVEAITPYWGEVVKDPTLLGSTTIRGHAVWVVSFAAPQIPGFFEIEVDKATGRVRDLHMTASAHFMHHTYGPFNSRITITPPK
jgi:hypothetical protein